MLATAARPAHAHLVAVAALRVEDGRLVERYSSLVRPVGEVRVPGHVSERLGCERGALDEQPTFAEVAGPLAACLADGPVFVVEAERVAAVLHAEARRISYPLRLPRLLGVERLAVALGAVDRKPSLAAIAARMRIPDGHRAVPDGDAHVLRQVVPRLLALAVDRGVRTLDDLLGLLDQPGASRPLWERDLAQAGDGAGVYLLAGHAEEPLYVGKARRLAERLSTYGSRQLALTRRLDGLGAAVERAHVQACDNELEALVLEDREIRRLAPRYNTQRQHRPPRTWLYLPPPRTPGPAARKRPYAAPRIGLAEDPAGLPGWRLGPFRSEEAAAQARNLARALFSLDAQRTARADGYTSALDAATAFLEGDTEAGVTTARAGLAAARAAHDYDAERRWARLLRLATAYCPTDALLPADPRGATYAVLRLTATGVEGFVLERLVLVAYAALDEADNADPATVLAERLLGSRRARTGPSDQPLVRRWLAAASRTARLLPLTDPPTDAEHREITAAAEALVAQRAASALLLAERQAAD